MASADTVAMAIRKFSSRKLFPMTFLTALMKISYPVIISPTRKIARSTFSSIFKSKTCSSRRPKTRNAAPTMISHGNLCLSSSSGPLSSMGHIWKSGSAACETLMISRSTSP